MTKQEAIAKAGSQSALARLLGITPGAITQWGDVPKSRIWQLKTLKPEWFNDDTTADSASNPSDRAE